MRRKMMAAVMAVTMMMTVVACTDRGDVQTLIRKAPGEEDISGDYNVYDTMTEKTAGKISVTLKGDGDGYVLALWTADGYSYALSLENPVTEEELLEILALNLE